MMAHGRPAAGVAVARDGASGEAGAREQLR